jgi:hypothetical protein
MDDVLAAIGTLGLTGLEEVEAASGDFKTAANTGAATGDGREATAGSPAKAYGLNTFLMLHDAGRRYAPELLGNSIRAARQSAIERCVNRLEEIQSGFNPNRYLH